MSGLYSLPNPRALGALAQMARQAWKTASKMNFVWQPLYEVLAFTSGAAIDCKFFATATNQDNNADGNYESAGAQPMGKNFICTGIGVEIGQNATFDGAIALKRYGYFKLVVNNKKVYDNRLAQIPDVGGGFTAQSATAAADNVVWGGGGQGTEACMLPVPIFIRAQEPFYAQITSSGQAIITATGNWLGVTLFGFRTELANQPGAL